MKKKDIRLIESIAVNDGQIENIDGHEKRYQESYFKAFGSQAKTQLLENLELTLPPIGLHKLRIEYGLNTKDYALSPYQRKPISTLKLIVANGIDYSLKYADRKALDELYKKRENCHDVLIIKNNLLTDTSIGNLLLFDGVNWFTPRYPLLLGTQRARLLTNGTIKEANISIDDISSYKRFQVINAMRPFSHDKHHSISGIIVT